jgi:hypothetical protein
MRWCVLAVVTLATVPPAAAQVADRSLVHASLENLMLTGEPGHNTHDEGEWLQAAVASAFARNDTETISLAQRASAPIRVRVMTPVSATTAPLALTVLTRRVLSLDPHVSYRAEILVASDGGEWISAGSVESNAETSLSRLPAEAVQAGVHRLQVVVRVTYESASGLPPEERSLPDVVYGRFDPGVNSRTDARLYLTSAIDTRARRLHPSLPDLPFGLWLQTLVLSHGGQFDESYWRTSFCEERIAEAGLMPQGRNICAMVDFMVGGAIGRVWVRTGRVEGNGSEVRWLVEAPEFDGMTMGGVEFQSIASLPDLLATPRESWRSGDVAVAPEEMSIQVGRTSVRLTATVRNIGPEPLHGVYLSVVMSSGDDRGVRRAVVMDLPAYDSRLLELELPLMTRHAAVVIQALQIGEHAPHETWTPDPTPENTVAFRIVNPAAAPRGYAARIAAMCGPVCRGY